MWCFWLSQPVRLLSLIGFVQSDQTALSGFVFGGELMAL